MVHVGFSEDLESAGGSFLSNCEIIPPNSQANDEELQDRLWELSCRLTKLKKMIQQDVPSMIPDPFVLVDMD